MNAPHLHSLRPSVPARSFRGAPIVGLCRRCSGPLPSGSTSETRACSGACQEALTGARVRLAPRVAALLCWLEDLPPPRGWPIDYEELRAEVARQTGRALPLVDPPDDEPRRCRNRDCRRPMPAGVRSDWTTCGDTCRKAANRQRARAPQEQAERAEEVALLLSALGHLPRPATLPPLWLLAQDLATGRRRQTAGLAAAYARLPPAPPRAPVDPALAAALADEVDALLAELATSPTGADQEVVLGLFRRLQAARLPTLGFTGPCWDVGVVGEARAHALDLLQRLQADRLPTIGPIGRRWDAEIHGEPLQGAYAMSASLWIVRGGTRTTYPLRGWFGRVLLHVGGVQRVPVH